jgi:saccharopine dehydrogenase-like NADP-dependent oxidoreductase
MIVVIGAAGTIGRTACAFLDTWGAEYARRDFRLEGEEHVDVRDPSGLVTALAGASVCVNCADYRFNLDAMEGALAAGSHYVDLGGLFHTTRLQLDLGPRFLAAGSTAVLGMGSAPGKTNLLAKAAVARLGEEPRSLEIWAATRDPAAADHPFPITYSAQTLVEELTRPPMVLTGGELREAEPLSGRAERELPELGRVEAIYTLHSELATLPEAFPSLEEASFRLSLPAGLVEKLLALGEDERPEPYVQSEQAVAVHLVEVLGESRSITGAAVTRGGSARSTSEPAARAAVELAEGRVDKPGAHPPESAIDDPEAFLALLDTDVRWQ